MLPKKRVRAKRWAQQYDACAVCGTTERPHRAGGRCKRCDDRWRYGFGRVGGAPRVTDQA